MNSLYLEVTNARYPTAQESKIQNTASNSTYSAITQKSIDSSPQVDLSIEGMRSQQFSDWIFVFLMISILIFTAIVIGFMFSKNRSKKIRFGERMMFTAIILGIVIAVMAGAVQLLGGYLF